MKKMIMLLLFIVVLSACSAKENNVQDPITYDFGMLDVEKTYTSLGEIVNDSTLIAEVELEDQAESINFGESEFTLSKVNVNKIFKGDSELENTTINLLELSFLDIKIDKGNGKFLLFLKPYEGPITSSAFVVTGVYQGRFKYNDEGNITYDAEKYGGVNKFQIDFVENYEKKLLEIID